MLINMLLVVKQPTLGLWLIWQDEVYQRTRRRVLSNATNPYFFSGRAGEGVGGSHIGLGWVWPMSVIMRALTSDDDAEIMHCLHTLKGIPL
jgi:hypothetical protein